MTKNNKLPSTLSALLREHTVADGVQLAEQHVKLHPSNIDYRYSLFQLLCIIGDWSRALQQIQLCAKMDANYMQEAQLFRELIGCEMFRQSCFLGKQKPGFILPPPDWVNDLIDALTSNANGESQKADEQRNRAFNTINDISGEWNNGTFEWASDSDSRIGPVVELVTGGVYIWLPFSQISTLQSASPVRLTDLLWKPVNVTLHNGDTLSAWLFTRYSGSEKEADALTLCRETAWRDGPGETFVQALGQKIWLTNQGDINLLDLTDCTFHVSEKE